MRDGISPTRAGAASPGALGSACVVPCGSRPARTGEAAAGERVVGPLELFYDWPLVVLVAPGPPTRLAGHLTLVPGLGEFPPRCFTLVWIA